MNKVGQKVLYKLGHHNYSVHCGTTVTDGGLRMAGRVDFMFGHPRSLVASWWKL